MIVRKMIRPLLRMVAIAFFTKDKVYFWWSVLSKHKTLNLRNFDPPGIQSILILLIYHKHLYCTYIIRTTPLSTNTYW